VMTKYQTPILFDPELPEDRRKEFLSKLEGIIASFGGEIFKQDDWGIRKLAYLIQKKHNAYDTFLLYSGKRGVVEEAERNIKIFDGVMRHMASRVEYEVKPAAATPDAGASPSGPESAGAASVTSPPGGGAPDAAP